jgi:hypothetical protein
MKVGGRDFDSSKRDVEQAMRGEQPESIQKYAVEVNGMYYPPKQVLARITAWERQSFTTMEAQRVLNKIGFRCGVMTALGNGRRLWEPTNGEEAPHEPTDRIAALEAAVATAQEAIAGLAARVRILEGAA